MGSDRLPDEERRALAARIATIYSRQPGTIAVSIVNASLIVMVVMRQHETRTALIWLMAVILLSVIRFVVYGLYRREPAKIEQSPRWAHLSVVGSFASGALWGLGPLVTTGGDPISQWLWAFAIGGMCSGAASLHAAHLRTALGFVLPACLPLAVSLLMLGTFEGFAAGIMSLAFIGVTSFTAVLFSREFGKLLALRSALERRAVELHDANRRLSREIDDHRETSDALHQSQKMEALGNLTGGFAHDFNNLLMVILGSLDSIGRQTRAGPVRKMIDTAVAAAESGANLTSRLLAFARKQTLAPRVVDINAVVANFEALLRRAVSGAIAVDFAYAPGQAVAPVDPAHLEAALLNLVVNARDAMPNGGVIRVLTAHATLDDEDLVGTEARPGRFVTVAVSDNGEGMPAEVAERVFEPFFTTKAERGSGLGLPQVYGFARQSGGFVRLDSEPGMGTVVTLFMPASDEQPAPAASAAKADPDAAGPLSVLLVDDNPGVIAVLSTGLGDRGWRVATASGAEMALALIEGGASPDIVVTDIDMPGAFNGIGLEQRLRERRPGLPVLLISGAPIPANAIGQDTPFLIKPFRNQTLIAKIEQLVRTEN